MEPDIAPLAKRLAEENNVNWQHLQGSGANGRIVERDVLEYLARVMSGEEALNPTPEPVPDGMEAWPDEDVKGYYTESAASATMVQDFDADDDLLDVSDDMYDPKSFNETDLDFSAELPQTSSALAQEDLDEDVFLFDDNVLSGDFEVASESSAQSAANDDFDEVDMLLDDDAFEEQSSSLEADAFGGSDPFAEADTGFAFDDSFEADSTDEALFDSDTFLLEDDESVDLAEDASLADSLLRDNLMVEADDQQAAYEAADELFDVDLDEEMALDENAAALFVDVDEELAEPLAAEADELFGESDDFAQDALSDLLPADVLVDDVAITQETVIFDDSEDEDIEDWSTEVEALTSDALEASGDDDLFMGMEETPAEAGDELFDFSESDTADDEIFVEAETEQSNESLFDFSSSAQALGPDEEELEDFVEAEVSSVGHDLDFEANAEEIGLPDQNLQLLAEEEDSAEELSFEQEDNEVQLESDEPELPEETIFEEDLPAIAAVAATANEPEVLEEPVVSESVEEPAADIPAVAAVASSSPTFINFGLLLRRQIDASPLQEARGLASEELNNENLDMTIFMLRAAAKAAGDKVGFARIQGDQIKVSQVSSCLNASLRETLKTFADSKPVQELSSLELVVANMSKLDIDDAVLNLPVPVLTLGREHNGQMTLALSGHMAADKGSSLLADIAELLENPVRLLI
ncbi:MAG: E3 binding domain-containing protein [Trueperaceae bacterium]|nr:E3 binding domain-containing protein [Trueperaceae bacterium]